MAQSNLVWHMHMEEWYIR